MKVWLGHLGFTLTFASVWAKSWRLHRVFNNPLLEQRIVTNRELLSVVASLMLADVVVLAVWTATNPLHIRSTLQRECIADNSDAFVWTLLSTKIALFAFGLVLTFQIRNLPE